jgi:hypothetical protein
MPEYVVSSPPDASASFHPFASQFDIHFRGRRNAHGTYDLSHSTIDSDGKVKGKALMLKLPSADDASWLKLWSDHLYGVGPGLGVFPVAEDGTCCWGCIDVDSKTANAIGTSPQSLARKGGELGLPLIVCQSKSKNAAHLYMFAKTPVQPTAMRAILEGYRNQLGLPESVEVFPKVSPDTATEFPGGWVNMPYFGATRSTL